MKITKEHTASLRVILESEVGNKTTGRFYKAENRALFVRVIMGRKVIVSFNFDSTDEVSKCVQSAHFAVTELEQYGITYPAAWITEFITLQFRTFRDSLAIAA